MEPSAKRFKKDDLSRWAESTSLGLETAIQALEAFIQINYTGPNVETPGRLDSRRKELNVAHYEIHKLAQAPDLLAAAISSLRNLKSSSATARLWLARSLVCLQSLLETVDESICAEIFECYTEETLKEVAANKLELSELLLEVARAQLVYEQPEEARSLLEQSASLSGFIWTTTGVQGRRTQHQQQANVQLTVLAKSRLQEDASNLVQNVALQSDLLLERPEFDLDDQTRQSLPEPLRELDINNQPALSNVDAANLLLQHDIIMQTNPTFDVIIASQLMAPVLRVIHSDGNSFVISGRAFWLRSVLESMSSHTLERGALQMACLVEQMGAASNELQISTDERNAVERLKGFHMVMPIPKYMMDLKLATRYLSLGLLKDSIEIYRRLDMGGDAALCLAATGEREQALVAINAYLEANPTDGRAYGIKGDILSDPDLWQKAWEVGKNAPSKRSLGKWFYQGPNKNLDVAIGHLEESLTVEPHNFDARFLLGCIFIEQQRWQDAANAFTRAVALDPNDVKSWSNLAAVQIQLEKPQQALHALKRAMDVDQNSEPNWRVWCNYIQVACDLRDWDSVTEGLNKLLSIKQIEQSVLVQVAVALLAEQYQGLAPQKGLVETLTMKLPKAAPEDMALRKLAFKVAGWAQMPGRALETLEEGYKFLLRNSELMSNSQTWKLSAQYCMALCSAYEQFGDLPGRMGAGSKLRADWPMRRKEAITNLLNIADNWRQTEEFEILANII